MLYHFKPPLLSLAEWVWREDSGKESLLKQRWFTFAARGHGRPVCPGRRPAWIRSRCRSGRSSRAAGRSRWRGGPGSFSTRCPGPRLALCGCHRPAPAPRHLDPPRCNSPQACWSCRPWKAGAQGGGCSGYREYDDHGQCSVIGCVIGCYRLRWMHWNDCCLINKVLGWCCLSNIKIKVADSRSPDNTIHHGLFIRPRCPISLVDLGQWRKVSLLWQHSREILQYNTPWTVY